MLGLCTELEQVPHRYGTMRLFDCASLQASRVERQMEEESFTPKRNASCYLAGAMGALSVLDTRTSRGVVVAKARGISK